MTVLWSSTLLSKFYVREENKAQRIFASGCAQRYIISKLLFYPLSPISATTLVVMKHHVFARDDPSSKCESFLALPTEGSKRQSY